MRTTRDQVVSFRAGALHLDARLPSTALVDAARPVGLQDTPPGNAAVAAAARVEDLSPQQWVHAIKDDKSLIEVWAMRGSPIVFPTADLPVFTTGLRPDSESAMLHFLGGMAPAIQGAGVRPVEFIDGLAASLHDELDGRVLTKRQMGATLAPHVPKSLRAWFADEDTFTSMSATVVRPIALQGVFVFAPRTSNEASFVRTDQWLRRRPPRLAAATARAELVRRFLRAFGPATTAALAWWAGIDGDQAARMWKSIEPELSHVRREDGSRAFVLSSDLPRLEFPPGLKGVRLLPPHDPALMVHDRATLIEDVRLHKRVWRSIHNPGAVLVGTRVAATWGGRKKGKRLVLTIDPLGPRLKAADRAAVEEEATRLAKIRGCESAEVRSSG